MPPRYQSGSDAPPPDGKTASITCVRGTRLLKITLILRSLDILTNVKTRKEERRVILTYEKGEHVLSTGMLPYRTTYWECRHHEGSYHKTFSQFICSLYFAYDFSDRFSISFSQFRNFCLRSCHSLCHVVWNDLCGSSSSSITWTFLGSEEGKPPKRGPN